MGAIRDLAQDYKKWLGLRTGVLYLDNGGGEFDMGNVDLVSFLPEREAYPVTEGETNLEVDVAEFIRARSITVALDKFGDYQIWEHILGITATDMTAGTQHVTAESVSFGAANTPQSLTRGHGNESPVSNFTIAGSAENTDFFVDYQNAIIFAMTGGNLVNTTKDVDYAFTTQASKRLKFSESEVNTEVALRFAHELLNQKIFTIKMTRARLAEIGEVQLAKDEPTKISLTFVSMKDSTQSGEELGYTDITQ